MQTEWIYRSCQIVEGLKPNSTQFRYYFTVSDNKKKKCHYCVWIADDVLSSFDPAKDFNAIAASQKAAWQAWVKEKIDAEDFNNRALKIDKTGKTEINLSELTDPISMDS